MMTVVMADRFCCFWGGSISNWGHERCAEGRSCSTERTTVVDGISVRAHTNTHSHIHTDICVDMKYIDFRWNENERMTAGWRTGISCHIHYAIEATWACAYRCCCCCWCYASISCVCEFWVVAWILATVLSLSLLDGVRAGWRDERFVPRRTKIINYVCLWSM